MIREALEEVKGIQFVLAALAEEHVGFRPGHSGNRTTLQL